jgi:TolB protein
MHTHFIQTPFLSLWIGILRAVLLGFFCVIPLARAELSIDIVGGQTGQLPLVLTHWAKGQSLPSNINQVIRQDLQLTAAFQLLSSSQTPADVAAYDRQEFPQARASLLGFVTHESGMYQMNYALLGASGETLLSGVYTAANAQQVVSIGHDIAAKVYEKLIGAPAFFNHKLAYIIKQGPEYSLHLGDVDGSRARPILKSPTPLMSLAWQPDGKGLAYVSFEAKKPIVYVQNLASGQRRILANFQGSNSSPAFAPDGQTIALSLSRTGNTQLYRLASSGQGIPQALTKSSGIDTEAAFSPDGRYLAYTSDKNGRPMIYILDVLSGDSSLLPGQSGSNFSPNYSPDGQWLTYVRKTGGQYSIVAYHRTSQATRILASDSKLESPSFAPNSKVILFTAKQGGSSTLYVVPVAGGEKIRLNSFAGDIQQARWSPKP